MIHDKRWRASSCTARAYRAMQAVHDLGRDQMAGTRGQSADFIAILAECDHGDVVLCELHGWDGFACLIPTLLGAG